VGVKGVGDITWHLLLGDVKPWFLEDFVVEMVIFALLAVVGAVTIYLSSKYLGGTVDPVVPAVAAYLPGYWYKVSRG